MPYFLLGVSIILCVCKSASYNYYTKEEKPDTHGVFRFNFVSYLVAATLAMLLSISGNLSWQTVLCALGYAVIVLSLQTLLIVAMKMGSMSTTSLLNLYGMVIPALAGSLFWREPFGIAQNFGLLAMIASIFFLREQAQDTEKKGKGQGWIAIACFVLSGCAGLMEKIHQSTPAKAERSEFLAVAYCTMLLLSLLVCVITRKNGKEPVRNKKRFLVVGTLVGAITGVYGSVNLFLAGALNSLIYYPVANGGALLLTVLISVAVFKEKPTRKKILGFILGLASVILLCLPTA